MIQKNEHEVCASYLCRRDITEVNVIVLVVFIKSLTLKLLMSYIYIWSTYS